MAMTIDRHPDGMAEAVDNALRQLRNCGRIGALNVYDRNRLGLDVLVRRGLADTTTQRFGTQWWVIYRLTSRGQARATARWGA